MNESSGLEFNKTHNLKFFHNEQGVVVSYKKKKFILGLYLLGNKESFEDEDFIKLAKTTLKFHCNVRNLPIHEIEIFKQVTPNLSNDYTPFYKYVSNEVYDNYIKRGIFQLGTIEQYRNIENCLQRDVFEGHSFLNLKINNQIVSVICNSGFNYYIFCGTKSINSDSHKEKFGEKVLYFPTVKNFAEIVCRQINAKNYYIQNVEYSTLKLYINKDNINDTKIETNSILSSRFFDIIQKHLIYPSLFVKPELFSDENEVRIIFEMKKDVNKPSRFENKLLLNQIEVIQY